MTDPLAGGADKIWTILHSFYMSPVEHRGWPLFAASCAIGLTLTWVRRVGR